MQKSEESVFGAPCSLCRENAPPSSHERGGWIFHLQGKIGFQERLQQQELSRKKRNRTERSQGRMSKLDEEFFHENEL